jgi:1,4-alpha-glucan branching enzyme
MIKKVNKRNSDTVKVTFVLPDDHGQGENVSVVGDFNDWTPGEHKLIRRSNHTYSTNVSLEEGRTYEFRYFSEENGYFNEEEADAQVANEHGSHNSVLEL